MYLIIVLIYFKFLFIFLILVVFFFLLFSHSALSTPRFLDSQFKGLGFRRNVFLMTRATQKEEGTTSLKQIYWT